ncbi:phenylacetyl-CoA ligase [Pluteus cervinus]|uniref:Phenylacetyl-CoA ligase n=1 Tax=Pluteus cervinus TaxID=181527 RepID=A0ACD3AT49_9AGAR|nr:phenylacetyl-CoA ligase [Pluteus cervinus]
MEIHSPAGILPTIPDDLTVPQFIFNFAHNTRPLRSQEIPWLIEDETGRKIFETEVRERTTALANGLWSKYALAEDDVVLLFSRNHVDYPIAIWAVHTLGGVISGANPDFSSNELLYQIEATKARLLIVHPEALETALSAAREANIPLNRIITFNRTGTHSNTSPEASQFATIDEVVEQGQRIPIGFKEHKLGKGEAKTKLAFLSFSSGTTGKPKAVAIPHYAPITNVIQLAVHHRVNQDYCPKEDQRFRAGDVAIGLLPLYHIYGLVINLHFMLYSAMSLVIIPKFNLLGTLDSIVRHRISHLVLVPPHIVLLCKHPAVKNYALHKYVRFVMSGAAPLSHEVNQQLFDLLPDAHIGQAYGMTETCTAVTMFPITSKRGASGSAGQLMPGCIARVVKQDGSLAGYNEPGELVIYTPSVATCYANNEKATKETFINGWIVTGDEVKIDRNGEVWVLDRLKEIMKVRGFQVAPAELEGCLLDHADVSNACVVGIPDDYSGEIPIAYIVLTAKAAERIKADPTGKASEETKKSIIKHVADNKVKYKHLAGGVEFVDVIPTSPSGKLLRRVLRERAREMHKQRESRIGHGTRMKAKL